MTQQTNRDRLKDKLIWRKTSCGWGYDLKDQYWAEPLRYFVMEPDEGKFEAIINGVKFEGFSDLKSAQDACQADYDQRWTEGSEPEPFWKPIEQCPKVSLVNYLLHNNKTGALSIGYWNGDSWSGVCSLKHDVTRGMTAPTHFAEIPACEVQP